MADSGELIAAVADSWQPGTEHQVADLGLGPVRALAAVLNLDTAPIVAAGELPPCWHWLYFLDWPSRRDLGPDGHPATGPLLPPLPNRRRMFAGGRLIIDRPLRLGAPAQRRAEVVSVRPKMGRTGALLFVTVRTQISQDGRVAVIDEQDLVYRSALDGPAGPAAETPPASVADNGVAWRTEAQVADPPLLFRFSALTANTHRIHYDEPYAREIEGFAGLVVHGPLQAVLLTDQVRRRYADRRLATMRYRFRSPVFAGQRFAISGATQPGGIRLQLEVEEVGPVTSADVQFADEIAPAQ